MRLLPQSLFGRLLLLLLGSLLGAQLLSAFVHLQDRGEFLYRVATIDTVQHIAAISQRLNRLPEAERQHLVDILDSPPTRIRLGASSRTLNAAENQHAAEFKTLLQRYLPPSFRLRVDMVDAGWVNARSGALTQSPLPNSSLDDLIAVSQYQIQVGLDDDTVVSFWHQLPDEILRWPYRLAFSLLLLSLVVTVVSVLAARWLTWPLQQLVTAAIELGRDINRPPLDEHGSLEVRRVAQAFNAMQARLARYINDRGRLLASVSHDLKTPITRLRLRSEMLQDPALRQKFQHDLYELEAMVIATLEFMRGSEQNEPVVPVDINALLESLQEDYAETGGVIQIDGAAQTPFPGRLSALKRCFTNLCDNALKYGQRATVQVDDSVERVVITLCDQGPGIPTAELEQVFEPFYRLEQSRGRHSGGTGLGLSIARNIVRAHGGDLTLCNGPQGGLQATVSLPRR